ncbi:MAG: nuclear transport factor 2 family protein [Ignavibacteriaceae bacterium]
MKSLKNGSFIMAVFLLLCFSTSLIAQSSMSSTSDEIIALTYKIWKAENEHDMATRNKYIAEDYTEFNQGYSTRIDGRSKNFTLTDAGNSGGTSLADEMLNPKVQVYGDVAILTYNFAGVVKDNDGKINNIKAKSTRVYVKMNGDWKLVHANFGYDPSNN